MFSFFKLLFQKRPSPPKMTISKLRLMKKKDLEIFGRKYGIELDRRYHKDKLVNQVWSKIKDV